MNKYRPAALALAASAAILSVTACSAGITTASSPARSTSATVAGAVPSASTVAISGSTGSFPLPAGAKIVDNVDTSQADVIVFTLITPATVSAFYAEALPRAGYTVTGNVLLTESGGTAFIQFSGHGYKGEVAAVANFANQLVPGVSVTGLPHNNVTTIELQPQ